MRPRLPKRQEIKVLRIFTETFIHHNILDQASTHGKRIMFNRATSEEVDSVFTSLMLSAQKQSRLMDSVSQMSKFFLNANEKKIHHVYLYINSCVLTIR